MNGEEKIKTELENKFEFLKGAVTIQRSRRIFLNVPYEHFREVLDYAVKNMHFDFLSAITGLDESNTFAAIYHLTKEGAMLINIKINISKEKPAINTITDYFRYADIYEREMKDLLGIEITGLASGPRYPLPDNWPQNEFPLRKDWKSQEGQEKQGVQA